MAPSSAVSVSPFRISVSIEGAMSLLYPSSTAASTYGLHASVTFRSILRLRYESMSSSGASTDTERIFSFSPRFTASTLCPGIFETGSLYS